MRAALRWLRAPALAALVACASAAPAASVELWRDGDASIEWSGSVREIVTATRAVDARPFSEALADPTCAAPEGFARCPAFSIDGRDAVQSLTRARIQLDGNFGDAWRARVTYDHELRVGFLRRVGDAFAGPMDSFLGAEGEIRAFGLRRARDHRRWSHRLYRGWVRYEGEQIQFTVGRQRIPWGVGRLWNPIDRFNAIPPLAIEASESPGIDALEARWNLSGFSYLQAVYAPGTRSRDTRAALRYSGVVRDVDVSAMVGVFEEARTAGVDASANLGEGAWRLEAVWTDPERDRFAVFASAPREPRPFWQVVLSYDRNFDVGNGIYLLVEHLYDGNAFGFGSERAGTLLPFFGREAGGAIAPAESDAFAGSGVVGLARHTSGVQLGTDLVTSLRGDLLWLHDWNGGSDAWFASLSFGGFNAIELQLGVQWFRGPDRSAFGSQEALLFLVAEWFF